MSNIRRPNRLLIVAECCTKDLTYYEAQLPAKRVVCPDCEGTGKVLMDGLRGQAIDNESMRDPDFREAYFGGDYDVRCPKCEGRNVVLEVDHDVPFFKEVLEDYWRAVDEKSESDAISALAKQRGY